MGDGRGSHVFVATPCYGGSVTQTYMQSVLALMTEAAAADIEVSIGLLGQDALITRSRNTLAARFMRSTATHLLFVDADIGFRADDVFRLLGSRKEVVGGLYPLRTRQWDARSVARARSGEPLASASLDYVGEWFGEPDENGLISAVHAGTGFLMISRHAMERLIASYPETRCLHGHVAGQPPLEVFALFDCLIDPETRLYLSEDYAFCSRWRAIGGEIWLDTRSRLAHCGMSEFIGRPDLRWS